MGTLRTGIRAGCVWQIAWIVCAAVGGYAVSPRTALASWPASGRAICDGPAAQQHAAAAGDGAGGAIIAWEDFRTPPSLIVAQHVLSGGELDAGWPHFGRVMMAVPLENRAGGQASPAVVSDGEGGAIVVWLDNRSAVTGTDIFAQHVLASGTVDDAWPATGLEVCVMGGLQKDLTVTSDGAGGVIATWIDTRAGDDEFDVFAQHVLVTGAVDPSWTANGVAVCNESGPQGFPVITGDGLGGALVAWHDLRPDAAGFDVYAQHVLGSGVVDPLWSKTGIAVCSAGGDQGRPTIAPDGAHGALVAWSDSRVVGTSHVFAQHVLSTGAIDPAWPVNGRAVSDAGLLESRPLAVTDGAGGAIVTWQAFTVHLNMYAQHVLGTGAIDPAWPAGGKALSQRERQQTHAEIVEDGDGGAVVAWQDSLDIVALHVLSNGATDATYSDSARVLCNLPSQQGDPAIVATGPGGAIVTWTDGRSGVSADIFALQVLAATPSSVPGAVPSGIAFAPAFPNPASGPLALRFVLADATPMKLTIYDVVGRRVRELASGVRPAGETTLLWDARDEKGHLVGAGVYFARLEVGHRSMTQKLIRLK